MSHDTVMHLVKHLDKPLTYPARGKLDDKCGKDPNFVIRKIYKGQEVACKKTLKTEEEMRTYSKTQMLLESLMKLSECKNIFGFYSISTI